jgi:hypothetical protein
MLDFCFLFVNSAYATTSSSFYNLPYKFYWYIFVYYCYEVGRVKMYGVIKKAVKNSPDIHNLFSRFPLSKEYVKSQLY